MNRTILAALGLALACSAQTIPLPPESIDAGSQLLEKVAYQGRDAIHFADRGGDQLGLLKGTDFDNGTLEVDIAAMPAKGAIAEARGFAGLAFRVKDRKTYEAIYIRPTNGRADDQLRRNHSTQYVSEPEWPWQRLRSEAPGVYESYVDLVSGEWTHFKVVVTGQRAELYINNAPQACLIVKDMKKGDSRGGIALWIGVGTDAYFSNLRIKKED